MSSAGSTSFKPRRYAVLYYKRTNKMHKNRGTTREDGVLSVAPPPSCAVVLTSSDDGAVENDSVENGGDGSDNDDDDDDDGGFCGGKKKKTKKKKWQAARKSMAAGTHRDRRAGAVWSGINNALAKRAFETIEDGAGGPGPGINDDDVVALCAQWECEIVHSLDGGGIDKSGTNRRGIPSAGTKTAVGNRKRPLTTLRKPLVSLRAAGSGGSSSLLKRPLSASLVGARRVAAGKKPGAVRPVPRAPPVSAAPSAKMKKDANNEWFLDRGDETDESDVGGSGGGVGVPPVATARALPASLVGAKRRRVVSSVGGLGSGKKRPDDVECDGGKQFPGALGDRIQVPASVHKVMRPHQREGVGFLWNCVTGVSPALNRAFSKASGGGTRGEMGSDSDESDDEGGLLPGRAPASALAVPMGALLADEMGLGKTLMTIATIFALHRRQRDRRFIVVCPSSLVSNWAKEFDKWLGRASQPKRVIAKNGRGDEGLRSLTSFVPVKPNKSEVLIISYELFRLHAKVLERSTKIGLLVVDEGHRLKNTAGSQTLSALNSIDAEARILITGTPIQNNLGEFYNVANFAVPGVLGDLVSFRRYYERPMTLANQKNATRKQKNMGQERSKALEAITSTFVLRRLQKDVLKSLLPPRMELLLFCRPTARQCDLYREISNRAAKSSKLISGPDEWKNPLTLLTEVRKLCTHPALVERCGNGGPPVSTADASLSGKLIVLGSLVDAIRKHNPTDKVVIVSNYTTALTVIEESLLRPRGLPFLRLDGATDISSRQPLVDSFNTASVEHSFAFLLSSKAGGCGINLIGANRLVMVDADWNPATDQQAMARVYRQGQKKPCFVYRMFTTGTVEEVIYQRQTQKGNLAKLANDGGSSRGGSRKSASFTPEELRDCFTLKEGCDCDTKRKLGKQWHDYEGASSLEMHGCNDEPLLDVCDSHSDNLSFARIVTDDQFSGSEEEGKGLSSDVSSESEEESPCSDNDELPSEEEEFDG